MLRARDELPENADPILAVEAMEAMHSKDAEALKNFARELHGIQAAHMFSVAVTAVNYLTIKGMEARTNDQGAYLSNAISYIQQHGVEFASRYDVDPEALNAEVGSYISETLFPVLNGNPNLSLNFPDGEVGHTEQYVLALTYVTYAFFITAYRATAGEDDISFAALRSEIYSRGDDETLNEDYSIPVEPDGVSHFGELKRSHFTSPAHESTARVDISIPLQLAQYYATSDKAGMRETADDIIKGRIGVEDLLTPMLHFCRAVIVIVFNLAAQDERDSYIATANANISKARKEGLVTNRFGVEQSALDISTRNIMLSLSSLMSNNGAIYDSEKPDASADNYESTLYAYVVSMGMIADAYSVLVTGRLGLTEEEFGAHLHGVLS